MHKTIRRAAMLAPLVAAAAMTGAAQSAQRQVFEGAACTTPPALHCPDGGCAGAIVTEQGSAVEPKTGRKYFLDYPCDLKPGEKVMFILSIHGGGSYGNWHRHYFPVFDFKDKYRLVIATPNSPGGSWPAAADDPYVRGIVDEVIAKVGRRNIKSFWIAGHSAGSAAARRMVCDDYFKTKVDGMVATSGGRISPQPMRTSLPTAAPAAPGAGRAGPPAAGRGGPPGAGRGGAAAGAAPPAARGGPPGGGLPTCDFSFIYTIGSNEIGGPIPVKSDWADKYGCRPRIHRDVFDTRGGYVYDTGPRNTPVQLYRGGPPTGGNSEIYVYPGCRDGRVVADVLRAGKGHTQGHEPRVTEEIIKLMLSARGGKIAAGG